MKRYNLDVIISVVSCQSQKDTALASGLCIRIAAAVHDSMNRT